MDNPPTQHSPQPPAFEVSELDLGRFPGHNDLLPDNVQQEIQKKLADSENQLASLQDVISSVDHPTIGDHGIEHSDLALRIQSYRAALAPHRRLPNDVLLEIFFCCTPDRTTARPHLSSAHAEPNNLARVCSKWRQLVSGTPYFWRDIFVHYKTKEDLERNAVLVNDIVLLCGRMSVSLHIRVDDSEDFRFTTAKNSIPDLLTGVAGRLREFTWVGSDEILVDFLRLPTVSVELLENVCLSVRDALIWERVLLIQVFKNAHKLHTFTMEPMHGPRAVAFSPSILHLPWNQMTYLQFGTHMGWDEFLILLYQCPNLTVFRGCIRGDSSASYIDSQVRNLLPTPLPVLPNLNELWINSDDRVNHVFSRLNFPNLTSFHQYDTYRVLDLPCLTKLLPFLRRSNCLTHLTLGRSRVLYESISRKIIHVFLQKLPSLVLLGLWLPLRTQTIDAIASGELVPKLETLSCLVTRSIFEPFMDMLEQRCVPEDDKVTRSFTRIWKVEVTVERREEDQIEIWNCSERVESLRAQGLRIEFLPESHPKLTFW